MTSRKRFSSLRLYIDSTVALIISSIVSPAARGISTQDLHDSVRQEFREHEDLGEHGGNRDATVAAMIQRTVERMYTESEENRFLEVTYANGDKEVLYFKDFASGAMMESVVRRAKKLALKRYIASGEKGVKLDDLLAAVREEFKENEDLPNTTNPDDWARISGKKGERIVYIRTLVTGKDQASGRSIDTVANTGQYL